jgi:hypothetical protein
VRLRSTASSWSAWSRSRCTSRRIGFPVGLMGPGERRRSRDSLGSSSIRARVGPSQDRRIFTKSAASLKLKRAARIARAVGTCSLVGRRPSSSAMLTRKSRGVRMSRTSGVRRLRISSLRSTQAFLRTSLRAMALGDSPSFLWRSQRISVSSRRLVRRRGLLRRRRSSLASGLDQGFTRTQALPAPSWDRAR